jgi:hypothetical protein
VARPALFRRLLVEAIRCDVNNVDAYNDLAGDLSGGEEVALADGRRMDAEGLRRAGGGGEEEGRCVVS